MQVKPHAFILPFVKKENLAKDTYAFYFDRSKENWQFHPGQYIQMILPHEKADDRGSMRYFTISSSPLDTKYLRIITKVVQSSFKETLFSLFKGQEVSFFGPNGIFYLQEKKSSHVFLAAGMGITPFISMLEYAAAKNLHAQILCLFSFSTKESCMFYERFASLPVHHPNIKVVYTLTYPDKAWTGEKGRISESLITKYISDVSKPIFYITGPPDMVESTVKIVEGLGVDEEKILQEHFSGY